MDGNVEIRKLPPKDVCGLSQILESGKGWQKLMAIVPKYDSNQPFVSKYTFEHIKLIEHASTCQNRACTEIFLDEWGTSGRKRPNLTLLQSLLVKAELFRAAEYVAVNLLQDSIPERPAVGPAAPVDISEQTVQKLILSKLEALDSLSTPFDKPSLSETSVYNNVFPTAPVDGEHVHIASNVYLVPGNTEMVPETLRVNNVGMGSETDMEHLNSSHSSSVANLENQMQETLPLDELMSHRSNLIAAGTSLELNTLLPQFSYRDLQQCTDNFCERPLIQHKGLNSGRKLGTGAFGSVYLGILPRLEQVAIKRFNKDAINIEKQFQNEVEALSRYTHPNLLPLLGYSCDGSAFCLVYQYMSNGSLQERLACQNIDLVLAWKARLAIALGTSRGILHLHTAYKKPLIHRDIKSANILLDHYLQPKLGDFGLVRLGANGQQSQSVALTTTIFGTSAYMAPEAFRGDISVKMDTFSFGVVLLELLTSLPPYDEDREGCDLVTHVDEICEDSIEPLLDSKAGVWDSDTVFPSDIYLIALDSLKEKRHRPHMSIIVQHLQDIVTSYNG